jgi:hypothetical protein
MFIRFFLSKEENKTILHVLHIYIDSNSYEIKAECLL